MSNHVPAADRSSGPFFASQLRPGDRYELSNGHPIYVLPASPQRAARMLATAMVLATDPAVALVGIRVGFVLGPKTLRAPDIAVVAIREALGDTSSLSLLSGEHAEMAAEVFEAG